MLQFSILVKRSMHAFQKGLLVYNKQEYMDLHMHQLEDINMYDIKRCLNSPPNIHLDLNILSS